MNKYIDADKLKEIVDRVYKQYEYDYGLSATGSNMRWIYDAINSLQQEQQMPDSTQLIAEWGKGEGYEQAEKDTIERACKWLFSHLPILVDYYNEDINENADRGEFIKLFRTQMEEQ